MQLWAYFLICSIIIIKKIEFYKVRYVKSELWCSYFCTLHTRSLSSERDKLGLRNVGGWKRMLECEKNNSSKYSQIIGFYYYLAS
jgi:hypothetical protein